MRKKFSHFEKKEQYATKLKNSLFGNGTYIYQNNTLGDLTLPKETSTGKKKVGPREQFLGDSYFKMWVGHPNYLLRLIDEVHQGAPMSEEKKLILDQPDTVTQHGKVEHVVVPAPVPTHPLNDSAGQPQPPDVLLNEDPVDLDGVEIILG